MTGCYIKGPQDTEFAASKDKQEICQCVCLGECAPVIASNGSQLRQKATEACLQAKPSQASGDYLAEVSFDMTLYPPEPIYRVSAPHQLARFGLGGGPCRALQSKIRQDVSHPKHQQGQYKYKKFHCRRPDVIVTYRMDQLQHSPYEGRLRDIDGAYVGPDHLKYVVEIKFTNDPYDEDQMQDYDLIAGEGNNAILLQSADCDCPCQQQQQAQPSDIPVMAAKEALPQSLASGVSTVLAGTALMALAALSTAILLADDVTGVGTLDDVLLPVSLAAEGEGAAMTAEGASLLCAAVKAFI